MGRSVVRFEPRVFRAALFPGVVAQVLDLRVVALGTTAVFEVTIDGPDIPEGKVLRATVQEREVRVTFHED